MGHDAFFDTADRFQSLDVHQPLFQFIDIRLLCAYREVLTQPGPQVLGGALRIGIKALAEPFSPAVQFLYHRLDDFLRLAVLA